MKVVKFISVLLFVFLCNSIFAQVLQPTGIVNRAWEKNENGVTGNVSNRTAIPYAHLREADVFWAKRVWRRIDLKEKINFPLYFPADPDTIRDRISLSAILWNMVVTSKELKSFADEDMRIENAPSALIAQYTTKSAKTKPDSLDPSVMVPVLRPDGTPDSVASTFKGRDVQSYELIEDWFFDKQRSVMDVRIIGIAPLIRKFMTDASGNLVDKGVSPLFYIYFPAARSVLARYECFNRSNDAERRSFDDLFWKRMFSSYVVKEENAYDRRIEEYTKGLDALLESERVKEDLFKFEHDLWEY